jgi:hypothetical protein
MRFTKIPQNTFEELQINAGILVKDFDVETGTFEDSDMLTATTGGITVNVKPSYTDFGDDIDNCPKNMMELKKIDSTEVSISTTALNINEALLLYMLGAADKDSVTGAIKPRSDLKTTDFKTIWWIGDLSDGGYIAVKISNGLSTDGFSIKSSDKGKGNISITITGHVSIEAQDVIPAEFYLGTGESDVVSITLDRSGATIEDGHTLALTATPNPDDATVTWASTDTSVATVSSGVVTAEAAGVCVITAKATKSGESAIATCIITVTEAEGEG